MTNLEDLKGIVDDLLAKIPDDLLALEKKKYKEQYIGIDTKDTKEQDEILHKEELERQNLFQVLKNRTKLIVECLKCNLEAISINISNENLYKYVETVFELSKLQPENLDHNLPNYNRYGFDIEIYRKILPYTKLAKLIENNGTAEDHAFKLAVLFGGKDPKEAVKNAWNYLLAFSKANMTRPHGERSRQPLHDALLPISLPSQSGWNREIWCELAKKHALDKKFLRGFTYADKITVLLKVRKKISIELDEAIKEGLVQTGNKSLAVKKAIDTLLSNYTSNSKEIAEKILADKKRIREMKTQQKKLLSEMAALKSNLRNTEDSNIKTITAASDKKQIADNTLNNSATVLLAHGIVAKESNLLDTKKQITENFLSKQEELRLLNDEIGKVQNDVDFDLNKDTSPKRIFELASEVRYEKVRPEHVHIAQVFLQHGMSEDAFKEYLKLKPSKDEIRIPVVTILGTDINPDYSKYYLKRLDRSDPRAAVLGKYTACCQSILDAGSDCVVHGITSDEGGFYAIFKGDIKKQNETDEIISQCWAWRNKNTLVFDSIETQPVMRTESGIEMVKKFYGTLAYHLVTKYEFAIVSVGTASATPKSFGFDWLSMDEVPIDYQGYRDSKVQRIVAAKNFKLLTLRELGRIDEVNEIITKCPEVLLKDSTYLVDAFKRNDKTLIDTILSELEKLDLKFQHEYLNGGEPPILFCAFYSGNRTLFNSLLAKEVDINKKDKQGNSLLIMEALRSSWDGVDFLLQKKTDINLVNHDYTLLHLLMNRGEWDKIPKYIKMGADVNISTQLGTVLHIVANYPIIFNRPKMLNDLPVTKLSMVDLLVKNGFTNISATDQNGDTALHVLARDKQWSIVIFLLTSLKRYDLNLENQKGETLAGIAIGQGNWEELFKLVQLGVNINIKNKNNESPTDLLFCRYGDDKWDVIKKLVALGKLEISQSLKGQQSPIMRAADARKWEVVTAMMDAGADVTKPASDGKTLLDFALRDFNWELAITLIKQKKFDINKQNEQHELPLNECARRVGRNFEYNKGLQELIKMSKVDVGLKEKTGERAGFSLLGIILQAGNWEVVQFLFDEKLINLSNQESVNELFLGILNGHDIKTEMKLNLIQKLDQETTLDLNVKNHLGETPLILAIRNRDKAMLDFIFQKAKLQKLNIDATDDYGMTALHFAIKDYYFDGVQNLVANKANINLTYKHYGQERSPLRLAATTSIEIVKELVNAGADLDAKDENDQTALEAVTKLSVGYGGSAYEISLYLKDIHENREKKKNKEADQVNALVSANDQTDKDKSNNNYKSESDPNVEQSKTRVSSHKV